MLHQQGEKMDWMRASLIKGFAGRHLQDGDSMISFILRHHSLLK